MFIKTLREAPADEVSKNAQLLIRAGFINKRMAGVYEYLPLGKMVLEKIIGIVREEMNCIGCEELSLTALQPRELWERTDRWNDKNVDIWFKTKLVNGSDVGLAWTHEEPLTNLMRNFISSYKDLPVYPYQFQIKFRNEKRSKSGLMRGREFWMKDLYDYSRTEAEHGEFYDKVRATYIRIFDRLGLGDITYPTFASGGIFSKFSEEFQMLTPAGEDKIFVHKDQKIAVNSEVFDDEVMGILGTKKDDFRAEKAIELGNIFHLGSKYTDDLGLFYTDERGEKQSIYMGCYGLGPSRVMGAIAEHFADELGLVWPENIAPAQVYLINIGDNTTNEAAKLYDEMAKAGIEVIWDDRDARPGEKFADADLMGIPHRVVVSQKLIAENLVEYKNRTLDVVENLTTNALFAKLGEHKNSLE
jgi:prolyl-tRNA synthetase